MIPKPVLEKGPVIPADVIAFATEHGVEQCLCPMLEATKRIFPSARQLRVLLEDDPEIGDLKFIVYEVNAPGLGVPKALEGQGEWNQELDRYYKATPGCAV